MKTPKIDDGGFVFPHKDPELDIYQNGLTRRDWFATFAPEPTTDQIKFADEQDRLANPHGDNYKPPRRSLSEIRADFKYAFADAMIAASKRSPR